MKKHPFYISLCLVVIFFFYTCTDDNDIKINEPPPPVCIYSIDDFTSPADNRDSIIDLVNCIGGLENYINVDRYGYFYPCFNPDNKEEIAYMRQDYTTFTGCNLEIWVFNYCTGEKRFVTDGICYSIDWSVKDWIVFTGEDRQLWKVKSNGDSLTQLTNSGNYNNYAMWNSEGSNLIYKKIGNSINSSFFLLIDEHGEGIDTFPEMLHPGWWHWSNQESIISCVKGNLAEEITPAYFNLNNRQFHEMPPVDASQYGYINDTDWLDEDKLLWLAPWLIGYTNIHTQEVVIVTQGYQNRIYHNLAASSDGKLIITEREDQFQISDCDIEVKHNLYIMNADGSNERKINIPE